MNNTVQTPAVGQLKSWVSALEGGDIHAAIEHHDAVCEHVRTTGQGEALFEASGVSFEAFFNWGEQKLVLKEQLAKPYEQQEADYQEGLEQALDLVGKVSNAKSASEIIRLAELMRDALAQVVTNAAHLDERAERQANESEEKVEEVTETVDAAPEEE